jgi:hypothetical protein
VRADEKVSAFLELEKVTRESLRFQNAEWFGTILAMQPFERFSSEGQEIGSLVSLKLRISRSVDLWQDSTCPNRSANRKNSRIGKSAISRKQPLLFSSKQREASSLRRATRRSVILAQVGVDNVIGKAKLGTMKNIHRWGFAFIAIGIALWMSGVAPQLGSILFVIGLVGLVIAWVIR